MIGDRELAGFREGYYRLLAGLFGREPTAEVLAGLAAGLTERAEAARGLHPRLGEGWRDLGAYLAERPDPAAAAEEFTALFLGPRPLVHPYESYYLTGRFYSEPLVAVRDFLGRVRIDRDPASPEPEDGLVYECEAMAILIDRQRRAANPDAEAPWAHAQGELLKHHLLVWGPRFARDLEQEPRAALYRGLARILDGFLALERDLIGPWGPEGFRTYEEARQAMTRRAEYRGPLFEAAPGADDPRPGGPLA